jgi:RND family efflux transporter MFP subunit
MFKLTCLVVIACVLTGCPASAEGGAVDDDATTCLLKPKQVIDLGSPVFGLLAKVLVDRADKVKHGQAIASLNTTVEEAQLALDRHRAENTTQLESAQTNLAWDQRELSRKQKLANNMFSRINDVDEYETKVEQDQISIRKAQADQKQAMLEAARSEAQLNLKIIKSPVDGVVTELKLAPGEYVYETKPIMTIVQFDPLNADIVLPSNRYNSIRIGMPAKLHLGAPVNEVLPVVVDAIDPVIDAASDTFRVRLVLPNPDNKIPAGIHCSASLDGETN